MNLIKKILSWYFSKDSLPYWCLLLNDCLLVFLSSMLAFWAFEKTQMLFDLRFDVFYTSVLYALLSLIGARVFRTYSGVVRYSSFVDLMKVAETVIAFIIATLLMWAIRVVVKSLYDVALNDKRTMRVLIYGALSGGVGLAKNIRTQRPRKFMLCGFISHDKRAKHMQLMGKNVYNIDDDLESIIKKDKIEGVLVSPLRVKEFRDNQEVQNLLIGAGCKIFMARPATEAKVEDGQLTDEDIEGMQLKEVSVEDLLPRAEIDIDMKSVGELLQDKCILITGSAGSIGSEMVRQIAIYKPKRMILIDQAETPQHDIRLMMAKDFPNVEANIIVTSIDRVTRMEAIFSKYRPDFVFHAAAYKHVPMMEDNPSEAVLNNIYGTKVIADLSVKYGVKKFVMISTDKAVNPTNVMGCSKRICEIYVQSLNRKLRHEAANHLGENPGFINYTQFVTTRFGNVLGSNGSVIPLFKEQIKNGGPVTVTDERIVRFFMLIPEACKLVLEAGTKGNGGEIFVFDMGQPVKIIDLARRMMPDA